MRALNVTLVLFVAACAPQPSPRAEVPHPPPEKPEWVSLGSTYMVYGDKRVFIGVGAAGNIKNRALLQTTADNRARAEITKIFETYSASTMNDFMSTKHDSSDEQHISAAVMGFSASTLSGVRISERFKDGDVMYVLAMLDLDAFNTSAAKQTDLPASIRTFVKQNAEPAFDSLKDAAALARKAPGMCRYRLRINALVTSADTCRIELTTQLPIIAFPCAGGDITAYFGGAALKGHVGAAGSMSLEGSGPVRKEANCNWEMKASIIGQLKGETTLHYEETANDPACGAPCIADAKVVTD